MKRKQLPEYAKCLILGVANDYMSGQGFFFYRNEEHKIFLIKKILDDYKYDYTIDEDQGFIIHCKRLETQIEKYLTDNGEGRHKTVDFDIMNDTDKYFYFLGSLIASKHFSQLSYANSATKAEFVKEYLHNENVLFEYRKVKSTPTIHEFSITQYL